MESQKESGNRNQANEIIVFEKGKRGVIHMLFGRTGIIILLLLLQILLLFGVFRYLEMFIPYVFGGFAIFTFFMIIHMINTEYNTTIKLAWIILFALLPAFGALLYIFIRADLGHRALKERYQQVIRESEKVLPAQDRVMEELKLKNKGLYNLASYVGKTGSFPIYKNSKVTYFPLGECKFEEMLKQMEKAEKFIYLEYFIVDEGYMWGRILKLLSDKAKQGVEIRMIYDGTCEFALLPHNYPKKLKELGIESKIFAPISLFVSTHYNYRDHRKILVIDGHTGFTGGVNLADEYINKKKLYGHWKDTAVMVQGEAVRSFTLMFLQMWNIDERNTDYKVCLDEGEVSAANTPGYVMPFGDCPLDHDKVGEMVYMDILNRAENYVHIMTPYLILDGEMTTALQFAARRGVDVKIILPHIPDKRTAFALAKSHYKELLRSGVKIYEYTPGFVHAKVFVSDDCKAVVGTINLDYRSLYHHFECGAYMEGTAAAADAEKDIQETLKVCHQVTMEDVRKEKWAVKLAGRVLKLIAPLM